MITWITDVIATAAYTELDHKFTSAGLVADVRELVDRDGNSADTLIAQIEHSRVILQQFGKVYIACDMGISRSRVIAIGLLTLLGWSFDDALLHVRQVANKPDINLALLRTLSQALKCCSSRENAGDQTKLLILGGSGFVGNHLLNALSVTHEIKSPSSKQLNLVTDTIELSRYVEHEDCRMILYAAHPKAYHSTSAFSLSLGMLKSALEVARQHNLIFVYISNINVFTGNARLSPDGVFVARENDQPIPYGTYSESKFFGEKLVQLYKHNYKLDTLVVRVAGLYGHGMSGTCLIPKLIRKAAEGMPIATHRYLNGLPEFDLLHIRDVCSAIEKIIVQDKMPEVVHIGSASFISTHELAQRIVELACSTSDISLLQIQDEVHNVRTEYSDYLRQLGWRPSITIRDGLSELINCYTGGTG